MNLRITIVSILCLLLLGVQKTANGQAGVLNPADPDVVYTSTNHPAAPAWGQISKWGHTNRLSWGPFVNGYKSYYFQGMAFRLKFPKSYQHNVADGKKYPVFVFLHGLGEWGNIWDNELQLLHGGQTHAQHVDDGTFDGFLVYPQSGSGYLPAYFGSIANLLDSMVKYVKADLDRVILSGLSAGGQSTWDFMQGSYANRFCAAIPISAAQQEDVPYFSNHITIPVWVTNGGKDNNPAPGTVIDIINAYKNLGGSIQQTFWPTQGHGVWNSFWAIPEYWPYLNVQHKANPLVYFGRTQFCPNEAVSVKLGLQAGFAQYEWQKDGITIGGATTKDLQVTAYGTYRARFKRTASGAWSDWSPTPVVISQKQGTVTPPITINGVRSNVLPAPDGSTTVPLAVPNNYVSYEWRRVSDNALVGNNYIYNAPVGQFKVMVTEQFGCSSSFSLPFTVINANGPNGPDPATNVSATATSNTTIKLDWNDNPTPVNNETGFEIYRSDISGDEYTMIAKTGADILTYTDDDLTPNTKYYYIIRAVNNTAASAVSAEVNATTKSDVIAPTAPSNLVVTGTSRSSVSLSWDLSTDDVSVDKYDIYVNGSKAYVTDGENNTFTVNNLDALQTYSFFVKARDGSGNLSPASNQVSAVAQLNGLSYKYYEGEWSVLPDFKTLSPLAVGTVPNVTLTPALRADNFGFLWEGFIKIPANGTYRFETNSDDGSRLWIGNYDFNTPSLVNNDGLHGGQYASGNITLTAGVYPIAIAYFEATGGQSMNIYWRNGSSIPNRTAIPNSAFSDGLSVAGTLPAKPSFLNVTATAYNKINLGWTDNSNNETGFEIVRSDEEFGTYVPIGTTAANTSAFIDSVGLSPNTKYFYKVRSINQTGASEYISINNARWSFDNNLNDGSGNGRNLTAVGNPTYSNADKKEGTHAIVLDGSTQYLDMGFNTANNFPSDAYTTRTISVWVKPTAGTISAANKIIVELGGNTNGMGLRFNSGALQAGIASSNNRQTAVLNNVTSNSDWISNGWNNIVAVYNVNTLQLYLNGVLKTTTNLPFSSVGSTSSISRIGATNSDNAFNSSTSSTNYGGSIDYVQIISEPLSQSNISALINQSYAADTTLALPPAPAAPLNLVATAQSPSSIQLSFTDNSSNETEFEIYRSVVNTNNFRLLTTLPASAGTGTVRTFIDNGLFANTNYYYHVRAVGVGGNSAYTSDALAKTLNNKPVIVDVANFAMRYASSKTVGISATDADNEVLTLTAENMPAFAVLNPTGNGTANLVLNPTIADQAGSPYTMRVIVADPNGGKDTTTFSITVNANYVPVINNVNNVTIAEGATTGVSLVANDQDGNGTLVWSVGSIPAFATLQNNGNGNASLNLAPTYAQAGAYSATLNVTDGAGGLATVTFAITVTDANPPSVKTYIRIQNSAAAPAPWNNATSVTTNNLKNENGVTTTQSLQFQTGAWNTWYEGPQTGNNSGVYPDVVLKDYYYFGIFGAPETVDFRLAGLTPGTAYNVTLYGGSAWSGTANNGTTSYTVNGTTQSLFVQNNTSNTVTFAGVVANASGYITVSMAKAAGTPVGYINAIVLEQPFNDGTAPVMPINLAAQTLPNGFIKLTWNDIAYNETSYLVYRSTSPAGPFTTPLNPGATNANSTEYTDATVASNTTYYYKIEAANNTGTSGKTNAVSATSTNKAPILAVVNDATVKTGGSVIVNTNATDDPGDVLTTTVSNLPAFAVFQNNSNGVAQITFNPSINDVGVYKNIAVKVADQFGAMAVDTFNLYVTDSSLRSVYISYGPEGGTNASAPWNNYRAFPFANLTLSNLADDAGINTGFSIKTNETWTGNFNFGMTTGDNSGIFPDNVISGSIYTSSTSARTIQIAGLNPSKLYNVVFFTSLNDGSPMGATFATVSPTPAQSVTLNASYNSNKSAQLNGLAPSAAGILNVTLTKDAAATYLNLNAMIIQEYYGNSPLATPYSLFAESALDSSKVNLKWADRARNETGYQVWRSTSPNSGYTLVTTTAANATTYQVTGLTPNVRYYFKVRAANGASTFSNYSNVATAILSKKVVYINMNVNTAYHTPAPWNNTDAPPTAGSTFSNLLDNTALNSGYEMVITQEFNGEFYAGMTGTGIFPSNVMQSNYWADAGQQCQVKFNNLNISKKYRIGCFGSADWNGYFIANYNCNGKTVQLNSFHNNSKVVYLDQLQPNQDGELFINISTAAGSPYSFTGAFTIEAYDDAGIPNLPAVSRQTVIAAAQVIEPSKPVDIAKTVTPASTTAATEIKVYPNPFQDKFSIELTNSSASKISVLLYDGSAQLIYRNDVNGNSSSSQLINVSIPNAGRLKPGMYVLNVLLDGKVGKTVKLIKLL